MESSTHDDGLPTGANITHHHDLSPPNEPSDDIGLSPIISIKHRPGYQRVASVSDDFFANTTFAQTNLEPSIDHPINSSEVGRGLGLQNVPTQRSHSISRVPVGSKSGYSPSSTITTPTSGDALLSPPSRLPSTPLPDLKEHIDEPEDAFDDRRSSHLPFHRANTASTASLGRNASSIAGLSPGPSGQRIIHHISPPGPLPNGV